MVLDNSLGRLPILSDQGLTIPDDSRRFPTIHDDSRRFPTIPDDSRLFPTIPDDKSVDDKSVKLRRITASKEKIAVPDDLGTSISNCEFPDLSFGYPKVCGALPAALLAQVAIFH